MNGQAFGVTVIPTEQLSYGALAIFTVLHLTAGRFQSFTVSTAGDVVYTQQGGRDLAELKDLQSMMTPWWIGLLVVCSYCFIAIAAYLGFPDRGWLWIGVLVAWMFVGSPLLMVVWKLPTQRQCVIMALQEVHRNLPRLFQSGDSRALLALSLDAHLKTLLR